MSTDASTREAIKAEHRRELRSYYWGFAGAVVLTAFSFLAAIWQPFGPFVAYCGLGVFAVAQILVHFRCFLHIDLSRQKREDLQLLLFTAMIIFIMVAGTVWILGSLMDRMM
ncbi:MAG: cytochrome o ubiquinol oxidase subunit IV [Fulvimarina manganoxydans]|uniref:cytochrome o ubiquinol oxidase subunit IV n=1 Tax=Fulvimarina manganoxydans TaxID=937218 RepID=UPI0023527DE2|nr:cytochrome o ubiquinol oxidase subunit IV [Fulvimarina manganoxydans]MCK5930860.1 cytochrome o ubiquinol oxidase subunit IV [Fulvimarina manganoxydans]